MVFKKYFNITSLISKMMMKPVEPKREDCCNSGCNPCIFDVYEKQLTLYNKFKENSKIPAQTENGISPLEYTKFFVSHTTNVCKSHKLISFKRQQNEEKGTPMVWWNPGDHFLLKYFSDTQTCTRAYTPVRIKTNSIEKDDFSVIIKCYNPGLVSNYLFTLRIGDQALWRGPYGSYNIIPNKYKRIVMIAQGTGIAPLLSIIDSILDNEEDMTSIILFFCCPSEELILFRDELYNYKSFWNFTYRIFLNSAKDLRKYKYQEPIHNWKLKYEDIGSLKPFTLDDQFLLCGSTLFMKDYNIFLQAEGVVDTNIVSF